MTESEFDQHAETLRLLEALLFASAAPLEEAMLAERLPEGSDVGALLAELAAHYAARGINLVQVAGGWSFRTAPDMAPRLNLERKVVRKPTRAAIETLAIIAYHQPVTRAEIEEIRGVVISKGTLDTLMEAGWIAPRGRRQTVGRPVTWGTTDEFLSHFGLAEIRDLPGIDELRAAGLVGPRPVVSLSEQAPADIAADEGEEDEEALDEVEAATADADGAEAEAVGEEPLAEGEPPSEEEPDPGAPAGDSAEEEQPLGEDEDTREAVGIEAQAAQN